MVEQQEIKKQGVEYKVEDKVSIILESYDKGLTFSDIMRKLGICGKTLKHHIGDSAYNHLRDKYRSHYKPRIGVYQKVVDGKKVCSKCGKNLPLVKFHKDSSKPSGHRSDCTECCMPVKKKYYSKNKKKLNKLAWEREKSNPVLRDRGKKRRLEYSRSEKGKLKQKEWKNANPSKKVYNRTKEQMEKIRESKRRYRDKNREEINRRARNSVRKPISKEKLKEYKKREYDKIKNNPYLKLIHYTRARLNSVLKGGTKTFSVSGCILFSREEFMNHIESLFTEGMSWENYGKEGWHIDHIRPLSSFDLYQEDQVIEANSLANLQPMWGSENCSKGSYYNNKRHRYSKK